MSLDKLRKYLLDEADFSRSWTDGRRGADRNFTDAYKARRLEIAEERETWETLLGHHTRLLAAARALRAEQPPEMDAAMFTPEERELFAAVDELADKEQTT